MRSALAVVGAVLLSAALVFLGNGLQGMVLPLRGVSEGFSTPILGALGAGYSLGFMIGCLGAPFIIRRVGHIRALAVFAAIAANAALAYVLAIEPAAWILLRLVSGAALAGMFMIVESWLNERADNTNRGAIFGAYLVVNYSAVMSGQLSIGLDSPANFTLFAVMAILISAALIPVSLTTSTGPAPIQSVRVRLVRIFRISPVAGLGAIMIGVANGSFGTLAPVLGARFEFGAFETSLFVSAAFLGAAISQLPLGYLSDRVDRRYVIAGAALAALAVELWLGLRSAEPGADATSWIVSAFVLGMFAFPLYGLCTAHLNDFVEPGNFVEASSGFLLLWGVGAMLGPILASFVMTGLGPNTLFLTSGLAHLALAAFALFRMTRRAAPATEDKGAFVPAGVVRTTPEGANLDPRSPGEEEAPPADAQPAETAPDDGRPNEGGPTPAGA